MNNSVGRPKLQQSVSGSDSPTRQSLLNAALECFSERSFEQVSTREIARRANVDAAMIRYYFDSKAGLFERVIIENIEPVLKLLRDSKQLPPTEPLTLMQAYYDAFGDKPELPRLIFQTLHQAPTPAIAMSIHKLFQELIGQLRHWLQAYTQHTSLRADTATDFICLSIVSCMVFPLIAPPFIQQQLGADLSPDKLEQLAKHNNSLILNGLFQSNATNTSKEALDE